MRRARRARARLADEPLPPNLLGSLFSNRSGTRETLNRHTEALEDGRMAMRYRKGWARAYSRVAAALISLRRARAATTAPAPVLADRSPAATGHGRAR